MARFSLGGDDDGVEEGPSNNRPLPKKPRTSNFNNGNPSSTSGARQRIIVTPELRSPVFPREESNAIGDESEEEQSEDESGGSFSDPSGAADYSVQEEEEEQHQNERSGGDVQFTEARLNTTPIENDTAHESVVARSETPTSICVTLTDPDVLDCPICLEPLSSPVYQCENGHISCGSCCTRMRNKCASCCWPIGYNRCRAIEKVLESIKISCRYKDHGCNESLNYTKKTDHEKSCPHTPCSCPHPNCNYVGQYNCLYAHFNKLHSLSSRKFRFCSMFTLSLGNNEKHVFLQERRENILFILNRSIEPSGSCVSVICVGPSSSNEGFKYEVKARDGESLINLKTVVESTREWIEEVRAKRFLLVPSDFVGLDQQLKLELLISRVSGLYE